VTVGHRTPVVRAVLREGRPSGLASWWPGLVALCLVAAAVVLVPSRPEDRSALATGARPQAGQLAGPGAGGPSNGGASGLDGPVAQDSAGAPGGHAPGAADATPGTPGGDASGATGDTSHCTPDGRQHGVTFHAPPCVPAFEGTNGGATATGVTATTIRVVGFFLRCEATTEALLTGLGFELATCEQQEAMMQAAVRHMNQRLELYGRQITYDVHFADCPFPEDLDTCLADAREVIATRPFAVVTSFAGTYQAVWEEFARSGVVMVGGGALSSSAYQRLSPYWWSREMSSTLQAQIVADWWCATLAGRPADHSGPVIHESVGRRGEVTRRAGFVYYDAPAGREAAAILERALAACGTELTSYAYAADLSSLQQQSLAATSRFIADGVTTVLWFDYLAPVFVLPEFTRQDYFPENVGAGGSGSNADSSHRAVDPAQWRHYFAVFPEPVATPRESGEAAALLRDGGWQGPIPPHPDAYVQNLVLLGSLLQAAGPGLTPDALRAVEAHPRRGGDGSGDASGPREGIGFGATDHNGVDDVREVYWDPDATSPLDGMRGALRSSDGGARRTIGGAWAGPDAVPVERG